MHTKEQIIDFMNQRELMVLSSINDDGKPQSALVGFGVNIDMQIIFGTSKQSRKAHNISEHRHVSVVIGWDFPCTLQIQGTVRPMQSHEAETFDYLTTHPRAKMRRGNPDEQHFVITPSWLRFTDVSAEPWDITELQLA